MDGVLIDRALVKRIRVWDDGGLVVVVGRWVGAGAVVLGLFARETSRLPLCPLSPDQVVLVLIPFGGSFVLPIPINPTVYEMLYGETWRGIGDAEVDARVLLLEVT